MNKIIVNATALRAGGALTILLQFIDSIPDDGFKYILFVDKSVKITNVKPNIQIVPQDVLSFYRRIKWDAVGLKKWIKNNNIHAVSAISLQNTNFRLDVKCPNYIYYHQSLPLFPYKWNLFKSQERVLWFYKNIYPFFVKLFINSNTEIFVQLNFIKEGFASRYNFPKNKIHVIFPNAEVPRDIESIEFNIDHTCLNLFYPATSAFYKNHDVLFKSLSLIDKKLQKKIVLYLTNSITDFEFPQNLENVTFVFLGYLPYEQILWMFKNVDGLLFPSYIETLGLPLIEAASFGLPIISSDLPYAKEVLDGYKGVTFVNYKNINEWSISILKLSLSKTKRFEYYKKQNIKSWTDLFKIIKENL